MGSGKSGAFDFSSADDFWKKLLDTPAQGVPAVQPKARGDEDDETVMGRPQPRAAKPALPRVATPPPLPPLPRQAVARTRPKSDFVGLDTGVGLQRAIAKAQQKSLGFVIGSFSPGRGIPLEKATPDPWARGDRRLWWAAGALMGLAIVVLTVFAAVSVGGSPRAEAVAAAAPALATADVVEPAPSTVVNTATPGWRPMIPARVRSAAEPVAKQPVASVKKRAKPHKPAHLSASR